MWGYDESREDLTYEHWHNSTRRQRNGFTKVEGAKFSWYLWGDYRISRANDELLFDKINRAISLW
jgi:hypothetical protein